MRSEKSNFVFGMIVGGALIAGGMMLGGMSRQSGGEATFSKISAQEIVLTDERGRQALVSLHASEFGGMISLLDQYGNEVITMGATRLIPPDGNENPQSGDVHPMTGVFDITNSDGELLFRTMGDSYGGRMVINNSSGRNVITMASSQSLNGIMAVHDLGGKPVAIVIGTAQGGIFQSQDRRENVLGRMP